MGYEIQNPILPGFYPDPSIIRVEDDFYLVTSSFCYYPGVPIFHSRDLAHWEQIGHVLDRPSQLEVGCDNLSGGIFAPTLRYHEGTFYMITTNADRGGNFIVTAADPAGPWSDPHWIEGAEGIDPSLFWDDDGRVYYTGTCPGENMDLRKARIWISQIDLTEFKLVGEKKKIWGGSQVDAWCPEAPHLYKKDGWYYLMIAEGGTEHFHAVTIARSREVFGPYTGYDGNPIMTHRHLGQKAEITNTGHADIVELKDGSWYMVMLASRPYGGYHLNMGRETFIAPMVWEDGWPVVCPGVGRLEWSYPAPKLLEAQVESPALRDDFEGGRMAYCWNSLGTPRKGVFMQENSRLRIKTVARSMDAPDEARLEALRTGRLPKADCAGFVGRRQQHQSYTVRAEMEFSPAKKQAAGLVILQNGYHSLRMEMALRDGKRVIRVIRGYQTMEAQITHHTVDEAFKKECLGEIGWEPDTVVLEIKAQGQSHSFTAIDEAGRRQPVAEGVDGGFLGSETAGGFVGAYIGMFATGNGEEAENFAAFDWFHYEPES